MLTKETSSSIADRVGELRTTFRSGRTRHPAWRLAQLTALERMLTERESDFAQALEKDLGRSAAESWLVDLAPTTAESAFARGNLRKWMRDQRVGLPLGALPGRAWYAYEPLGTVLIIGPWNYPVHLTLAPLVGALAAGNTVILKPSEHAPHVSTALARLVPEYLDPTAVTVVEGAVAETQELIDQALDHVFFTGGPEIGKAVMAAAAPHLTPVTLELGGKSPVIVTADANIAVAAKRIAWAKLMNSGQTCIAPDYLLVEEPVRDQLVDKIAAAITAFRTDDGKGVPLATDRQATRLKRLLDSSGGRTVTGGTLDSSTRRCEPTIIVDPDHDSAVMTEEIFGPILPVLTVDSLDTAIDFVRQRPKPLAAYLFSSSKQAQRRVLAEVSNGGTVINHLMFHVLVSQLPFGGVGVSGMGSYHGKWGFETFSHRKSVLRKPIWPDLAVLYPPYTESKLRMLRRFM
ncbi:aldehyde dehydrogenase family protein [Fodinicola feengrottensis]|uniref:Aldehyde dehydrogenase n=1 Tax=Fodinicola feengrottensis TaxID=435914 RepID=A0ABN2IWU7_9ACTN|nr:aldehyde dehydrogenase family protein [Fodinicola feengrottensis]